MAAGAGPAHAVYFGCYETLKSAGLKVTKPRNISDSVVHTGAGAVATGLFLPIKKVVLLS